MLQFPSCYELLFSLLTPFWKPFRLLYSLLGFVLQESFSGRVEKNLFLFA